MLNMLGLPSDVITYVVDDNPGKTGMYVPGTGACIIDNNDGRYHESNFVLITAPTHVDEIAGKEQNKHPGISFIRTSPNFSYI